MNPVNLALLSVILNLLLALSHGSSSIPQTVTLFDVNNGADPDGLIGTFGLNHISAVDTIGGSTVYAFPIVTTTELFPGSTVSASTVEYFQTLVADSAGFQYHLNYGDTDLFVENVHCSFGDPVATCVMSQIDEHNSFTTAVTYTGGLIRIATLVNGVYAASATAETFPITPPPSPHPTTTTLSSSATSVTPTVSSMTGSPSAAGAPARKHTSKIIGAVVGIFCGVSLLACLYLSLWSSRKRRARKMALPSSFPLRDFRNSFFTVGVIPAGAAPTTTRSKPAVIQRRDSPEPEETTSTTRRSERPSQNSSTRRAMTAMQERLRAIEALLANQIVPSVPPPLNDDEESIPPPYY